MRRLFLLPLLLALAACDSSGDDTTAAVYVGNQGIFSDNGGSVTAYDPEAGTATADAVANLGGLVQNLKVRGGRLYVFLNFDDSFTTGRGRIDVVDLETGERTQQIDVPAPRDWAVVDGTAYVSNLYGQSLTPVYLATGQTGPSVRVGVHPEGVAAVGNRVYVAGYGSNDGGFGAGRTVSVLSAVNNAVVETLDVGCDGARGALADGDGEVWIVCTGRTLFDADFHVVGQTNGEIVVLDGDTGEVVTRIPLDAQVGNGTLGQDAVLSLDRDELYVVVGQTLRRFDTRTHAASGQIAVAGAPISAVAYDDDADRLYLGRLDADSPYAADGTVTVHTRDGAQVAQFDAGVIPGAVAFGSARTPIGAN